MFKSLQWQLVIQRHAAPIMLPSLACTQVSSHLVPWGEQREVPSPDSSNENYLCLGQMTSLKALLIKHHRK